MAGAENLAREEKEAKCLWKNALVLMLRLVLEIIA